MYKTAPEPIGFGAVYILLSLKADSIRCISL